MGITAEKVNDDISMYDGDAKNLVFTVKDGHTDSASAVDITGFAITWTLYQNEHSDTKLVQKDTSGSDVSLTDAANGEVTVTLEEADTDGHETEAYYELEATDSSGNDQMLAVGTIDILENKD